MNNRLCEFIWNQKLQTQNSKLRTIPKDLKLKTQNLELFLKT